MDEPNVDWTGIVAEHKIQEALEAGEFRNLPGAGKPIDEHILSTSAFDRLIGRAIKEGGGLPAWLQLQREIDREVQQMQPYRDRMLSSIRRTRKAATRNAIADRLRSAHRERMELVNVMVLQYSMEAPPTAQRPFHAFRIKDEMAALDADIASAHRAAAETQGR